MKRTIPNLLSHKTFAILNILKSGDWIPVADISELINSKPSATSHSLKLLVDAGIIEFKKIGARSSYRLCPGIIDEIQSLIELVEKISKNV